MPGREERADRHRAVLLISLILLVINSAATGLFLLSPPEKPESDSLDALTRVPGGCAPPAIGAPVTAGAANLSAKQEFLLGKRLDVNCATWQEISALPGISDAVARRIVESRARIGGFRSAEELLAVPGIKKRRLKKILPFLAKIGNK